MTDSPASVLLIQREPCSVSWVKRSLAPQHGAEYHVFSQPSLWKGLVSLQETPADLVLLDLSLLDSPGLDALTELRRQFPVIPVIVLAQAQDVDRAIAALHLGAADYLVLGQDKGPTLRRAIRHTLERNRVERALLESEEKFRTIAEHSLVGLYMLQGGRLVYVNEACAEIAGMDREEMTGMEEARYLEFIHPADREMVRAQIARKHENPAIATSYEVRGIRVDGTERWLNIYSRIVPYHGANAILAVVVDITQRKRAEIENARISAAIRHAAEIILITDASGAIEYVNPAFERTTGYTAAEIVGQNPRILRSERQPESFYQDLWDTIRRGQTWVGHFVNRRKDGSLYHQEGTISPVIDEKGEIASYIAVMRDTTREEMLEQQLRQSQKLEAIGALAGGIAHDFNNILAAIKGYTELALESVRGGMNAEDDLRNVLDAANRARDLVLQILTFTRKGSTARQPISVHLLVKEAIKLLRATIPSTIQIIDKVDPNSGHVLADPTSIHQIIINLCANASYAMRNTGGKLEVELEPFCVDAAMAEMRPSLPRGRYVRLSVSDTGHGIEKEHLDHIFDPFFTTKGPDEGTGMGLATVKRIVSDLNGDISVYSEVGVGTVFRVYLPMTNSAGTPALAAERTALPGSGRVLVVDDEPALVALVKRQLEMLGYTACGTSESRKALEWIKRDPAAFDALITDQAMPYLSGRDLVRAVRQIRPDLPVILATGFSEMVTPENVGELGATLYLSKPFDSMSLSEALHRALKAEHIPAPLSEPER